MMINRISTNAPLPIATICHTYSIFLGSGSSSERPDVQEEEAVVVGDGINGVVKAGSGWVDEGKNDLEVGDVGITPPAVGEAFKDIKVESDEEFVVEIEDELSVVLLVLVELGRSDAVVTLAEGLTRRYRKYIGDN